MNFTLMNYNTFWKTSVVIRVISLDIVMNIYDTLPRHSERDLKEDNATSHMIFPLTHFPKWRLPDFT